jgi:hypothetical protein
MICSSFSKKNLLVEENVYLSWANFVSWGCSRSSCVTCCDNDFYLDQTLRIEDQSKREMFKNPHILIGVSFCFGDEYGYYLPLPTLLPLSTNPKFDNTTIKQSSIYCLSDFCLELICRFVGFSSIFGNTSALKSYFMSPRSSTQNISNDSTQKEKSNPLFFVSKKLRYIAIKSLYVEWKKGICVEWRMLSGIIIQCFIFPLINSNPLFCY